MKNKKKILLVFISLILIIGGLCLYLLLNRDAFITKIINSVVALPDVVFSDTFALKLLKGYGADFLWATSFALIIQAILWLRKKSIWYLLFCSVLGIFYELLQFLKITNGTADMLDILIYVIGSAFGIIILLGGKFYEEK